MAVYAYLRVSTGKQDGENQKNGIDDFAKKRGFVIDEYIDDEGKSGTLEPEKREPDTTGRGDATFQRCLTKQGATGRR